MNGILTQPVRAGEVYDPWEHICGDVFDSQKQGVIAVLTVYLDATRNWPLPSAQDPIIQGLSAYIGTQYNWRKFRKEWRIELAKKDLEFFHMTDFNYARNLLEHGKPIPKTNPHYGWTVQEMDAFLNRLHRTINRKDRRGEYRLESFTSGLIQSDFDETRPAEIQNNVQCSSYYIFNVVQILKQIAFLSEKSKTDTDPIHYIFAGGDGEGGRLQKLFKEMWDDSVAYDLFRLGKSYSAMPYSIKEAKTEPALQAADIAAFEMNKAQLIWRANEFKDTPLDEFRKSLAALGRSKHWGLFYQAEQLRESFQEIVTHQHNQELIPEAFKRKKNNGQAKHTTKKD